MVMNDSFLAIYSAYLVACSEIYNKLYKCLCAHTVHNDRGLPESQQTLRCCEPPLTLHGSQT